MTDVNVVRMGTDDRSYFLVAIGDGSGASRVIARCESEALAVKLAEVLRDQVAEADLGDLMERASWGARLLDTP